MSSLTEYLAKKIMLSGSELVSFDELKEWPTDEVEKAKADGKLIRTEDADGIICRQCPEGCWKEVEARTKGGRAVGVFYCEDDDCGGLIEVEIERLGQWEIIGEKKPKEEKTAHLDKLFAELLSKLQGQALDGAVKKRDYKWQKVQKKVEEYWKKYKADEKKKGVNAKDIFSRVKGRSQERSVRTWARSKRQSPIPAH